MSKRYFENFDGIESVHSNFEIGDAEVRDEEILLAYYGTGSYDGGAAVLFQRDGKLYEVSGSHCSCNGLEGQWSPGEVSWESLAMRPEGIPSYYDDANGEAADAWIALVRQHVPRA